MSIEEQDESMQYGLLNPYGNLFKPEEMEVLHENYGYRKINIYCHHYDKILYPLIFWDGESVFGVNENDNIKGVSFYIRRSLICLLYRSRNHFIHHIPSL